MTKEQKFYKALQDVFIGAKIEGTGGFVNLMRIKSNYYRKIEDILKKDIESALKSYPKFRDELFDKLYSFFSRYFTENGSIYFNSTPFHNNIYERVYTNEKDVVLFWKTQMLYYVKTDRIFRSLEIESDGFKFFFDVSNLEHKKANEKRSLIYELKEVKQDNTIVFDVLYSEKGRITKTDDILKELNKKHINITEEQLERAFRVFEKQSEVDFFINKNAKSFLQEQFKLWSYQYFWEGAKEWGADRVNQLQILKDIAYKIIDFIAQFEDELVKIWNKPKFVKNSNYVITLDRIVNCPSVKGGQLFPSERGVDAEGGRGVSKDGVVKWNELPFNPELKEKAKELRKAGNLSEVLLWNQLKNKQLLGLDFDRQKIIGNYIVDFFCKDIGVVVEIDGISHDGKIEYDVKRDNYLKNLGLKVIHIYDLDVKKNLEGVIEFLKRELGNTPSLRDTPLQEGNLIKKILSHPNISLQIKEWQELGIVDEKFKVDDVFENSPSVKGCQPQVDGVVYQGGGFFKYYELEQYEETLANTVYENHDIFIAGNKSPYEQYVFLKDEKMLRALEIDYENNKVKVDLSKLYQNIDIAETLSNLTGKWIKRIGADEVEFSAEGGSASGGDDGTKIITKDLDYKIIKPLIWWE